MIRRVGAAGLAVLLGCAAGERDVVVDPLEGHVAAARAAAGDDHESLLDRLCTQAAGASAATLVPSSEHIPISLPPGPASRPEWYAPPAQVFDNLYFVGQREYTAWAVTTSEGIIIIDPLFDYSVEAEVVEGLALLGLDPETIRYVIVSHAHRDHAGGARYLQDRFGARVILAAADWDLLEETEGDWLKPRRDIEADDGYELRLGETTLVLHAMPGHTPGTISTLIPVGDGGTPHMAALFGGTAFNFMGRPGEARWFREYIASIERFGQIVKAAGVDVLLSNHPRYDGTPLKLPTLAGRATGEPHPYVIGAESVGRYVTVAAECARGGLLGVE